MNTSFFRVATLFTLLTSPVLAADGHMAHHHADNAPKSAFDGAMQTMHQAMQDVPVSGDVDVDFVRGMIPHHQAAIDMAKIELAQGKNPANRKLAKDIIATQEKEIAQMRAWLAAHDRP